MGKKVKNLIRIIYWTIASPYGLYISFAILINIINIVITKVCLYKLIKDDILTVNNANIILLGELFTGFILASIIYTLSEVHNNETDN